MRRAVLAVSSLLVVAALVLAAAWWALVPSYEAADVEGLTKALTAFEAPAGAVDSGTEVVPCSEDGSTPPGAWRSFSGVSAEGAPRLAKSFAEEAQNQGWTLDETHRPDHYRFDKGGLTLTIFVPNSAGGERELEMSAFDPSASSWSC